MDVAYFSALAALCGSAIGGMTSFATSWATQRGQARAQRLAAEREVRVALFGRFLDEAARLFTDALQNERDEISGLMAIYALTNRIRLIAASPVTEAAEAVVRVILEAYHAPNISMEQMRADWIERGVDPLRDFSAAAREELLTFN